MRIPGSRKENRIRARSAVGFRRRLSVSNGLGTGRGKLDLRARHYCEALEHGRVLFFAAPPFRLPAGDREFLLTQEWAELRLHKNVSYRPSNDVLRGAAGDSDAVGRLHSILRDYSSQVIDFFKKFLSPYAGKWIVDFSSFRPIEENGRNLPLHKAKRPAPRRRISEPSDAQRPYSAGVHQSQPHQTSRVADNVNL